MQSLWLILKEAFGRKGGREVRKQEAVLRLDFVEDSTVSWPRQDVEEVLKRGAK